MPNGNKNNNGKTSVEFLPEEMRKSDGGRKREDPQQREVKFFIPPEEAGKEKKKGSTWRERFFKKTDGREGLTQRKANGDKNGGSPGKLDVFKMKIAESSSAIPKQEAPQPRPISPPPQSPPPPPPPRPQPQPPKPMVRKEIPPPPRPVVPTKGFPPREISQARRKMGITLMPEDTISPEEKSGPRQRVLLITTIVFLAVVVGGVYGVLKWYEMQTENNLKKIEENITAVSQQIKALDEEKNSAQTTQKKLRAAGKILDNHIYWSSIFSFLEANTVPDVYFKNLAGGSDGKITMSGAAKSYRAVAEQIISFRAGESVEKVSVDGASASVTASGETTEVNFEINLQLSPEIFLK